MVEVQLHPADIRKDIRYLFLSKSTARWGIALATLVGLVILTGLALFPMTVKGLALGAQLHKARAQRELLDEVMAEKRRKLDSIEARLVSARLLQEQMSVILGLPDEDFGGAGFPSTPRLVVDIPHAQLLLKDLARLESESAALLSLAGELEAYAAENDALAAQVPSISPLPLGAFVLTSPFGNRISPFTQSEDFHPGLDLAAREGTTIMVAGSGKVLFAGQFEHRFNVRWWRYGKMVIVGHGTRFVTIYAHLSEVSVVRGQELRRGEKLGEVGNTGWSTAPHLHYEVRIDALGDEGQPAPIDPRIYILNYQWKDHEKRLIEQRHAPAPHFEALPRSVRRRRQ